MKLTPLSIAACSASIAERSSTGPQDPPMAQAPKLTAETLKPVRPSGRYCTSAIYTAGPIDQFSVQTELHNSRDNRASSSSNLHRDLAHAGRRRAEQLLTAEAGQAQRRRSRCEPFQQLGRDGHRLHVLENPRIVHVHSVDLRMLFRE